MSIFQDSTIGDFVAREVGLDLDAHEGRLAFGLVEDVVDLLLGHLDELGEHARSTCLALLGLAQVLRDDLEVEGRTVVDQELAVAVEDHPARSGDLDALDAVLLGVLAHLVALEDLKVDQAGEQQAQAEEHDRVEVAESVLKLPDLFFLT